MFTPASRYASLEVATYQPADGPPVRYVRRRFVPDPATLTPLGTVLVVPMDRVDRAAYRALHDPELSWQLADANGAEDPRELTDLPMRILRVTQATGGPASAVRRNA